MRVLVVGASHANPGGVGAFCERAIAAIELSGYVEANYIPAETASLRPSTMGGFIRGVRSLWSYRRQRPDCVWLQYVNLPDLCYLMLAKVMRMQVLVTPHLGSNWRSQRNPVLRSLSGTLLRKADRLGLLSRTQEHEIALPASVDRIYIKTFLPRELLEADHVGASTSTKLRLIHAARLSEGKGTFRVIELCGVLRDRGVSFSLSIAGAADAETSARMRQLIADLGLQDEIDLLGRLSGPDLFDQLRRSDVLVHLSDVDSYPLIVLEALACSTFPLCMDLAGARDMTEQYTGHLVEPSSAVEAAADFLSSADPRDFKRTAAEAAMRVRSDYSWTTCAALAVDALRSTECGEDRSG